jgi:cyclohexanone monooxygenase
MPKPKKMNAGTAGSGMPDLLSIDPDALREKYREEREKRMHASRGETPELSGDLARYLDDPYCERVARDPVHDDVDVVVVGAGFGGLLSAAMLRDAGVARIRLIDKAGDVGGVWYWNRYPGARCDIESYIYMPLLEELGYLPTERYATADEIWRHAQAIARHYRLYEEALLQTEVVSAVWDEGAAQWTVRTDRGDEVHSQFVVLADGPFSRPKLSAIPGLETFQGHTFHTSRWDYAYTGGAADGDLDGLQDKVVGVIGTGATALQCVPPLGRSTQRLFVFQRTPTTVAVRANGPTDPGWASSLEPGWQRRRMENFTVLTAGGEDHEDLVGDGWTDIFQSVLLDPAGDLEKMSEIHARIDSVVVDGPTGAALKPYYSYLCKRPGFSDEYLETFNLPNVSLVDTRGQGVDRIYPAGVMANGIEYELDCLIFATGFDTETSYTDRLGFDVLGRDRASLTERWSRGISTMHGLMTSGFPNLFVMPGPSAQSVLAINFIHVLLENARHLAYVIGEVQRRGCCAFDVTREAEAAWVEMILERPLEDREFLASCTPGRFNNEGDLDARPLANSSFGGPPMELFAMLEEWRTRGRLEGLELTE